MKNSNLFLPGFHLQTLRRKPRSASQKLADERLKVSRHSISQLGNCFGQFIPKSELSNKSKGKFSRRRLFSKENTFWAFFSQVLDADSGCREVIRKVQAHAALKSLQIPSSSTAAYCQARNKLDQESLENIISHTSNSLRAQGTNNLWKNRRVIVTDGTGVSMPDTMDNQSQWPQSSNQKPGCGFPQARICACFCLHTGALLSYQLGSRKNGELSLLRQQMDTFNPGDIFLGDKGFCSYYDVSMFQERKVDSVISLARRIPETDTTSIKVLGTGDLLIHWKKPQWVKQLSYDKETWEKLPEMLTLRQIKVTVNIPGFRVKSYYIITTLTDPKQYPAEDIADLYRERWDVELFFRDIKTTMGMDILRCRTPKMIEKEVIMHFIVYNSIRMLMLKAAKKSAQPARKISFKASIQALRQWEPSFNQAGINDSEKKRLFAALISTIGNTRLYIRPERREPRCLKRRPKPFGLLTAPRHCQRSPQINPFCTISN